MSRLDIYIDGASRGNPGNASIGVVICQGEHIVKNISRLIGTATNNVAEYSALICALEEALILKAGQLKIYTDSELLYKQIKGEYKVRHANIKPLYEQVVNLFRGFNSAEVFHIKRENNRGADKLANQSFKEVKHKKVG